jgi:ankyrin repeat protein
MNEENEENEENNNDYNDFRGNTPLIAAVADGDIRRVRELIAIYTEQNDIHEQLEESSTNNGFTPLLWACMNSDTDMVRLLLKAGADPTNPGRTKELYERKITPAGVTTEREDETGSINETILRLLIEARIKRNEPRRARQRIEAAVPPYGKNYLKLLRRYTRKGGRRRPKRRGVRKTR